VEIRQKGLKNLHVKTDWIILRDGAECMGEESKGPESRSYTLTYERRRNLRRVRGVQDYPHFLDWGTVLPLFWIPVKNLLSTKASYGDQITLKPFSAGHLTRTPLHAL